MKATAQADRSIIAVQPVRLWRGFYTDCWAKSILKALNGFNAAFIRKKANILDFEPRTSERPASIRTKWAQEIVKSHIIKEIYETNIQLDNVNSTWQLPFSFVSQGRRSATLPRPPALPFVSSMDIAADEPIKICIVGAGISGLFLGFLLDSLKLPHISYEILESSQRIGGRVYTHRFGPAEKDYYDVGAMRFPKVSEELNLQVRICFINSSINEDRTTQKVRWKSHLRSSVTQFIIGRLIFLKRVILTFSHITMKDESARRFSTGYFIFKENRLSPRMILSR